MCKKIVAFAVFFMVLAGWSSVYAVPPAKIGLVDMQTAMNTSVLGKKFNDDLKTQTEKKAALLQEKEVAVGALKKALDNQAMVMNRETREEKERQLRIEYNDLKTMQKKYFDEMKILEIRLSGDIQKKIRAVVKKIGEREKYMMIMEINEAGVLYFPSAIDITEQVIKEFNAK